MEGTARSAKPQEMEMERDRHSQQSGRPSQDEHVEIEDGKTARGKGKR